MTGLPTTAEERLKKLRELLAAESSPNRAQRRLRKRGSQNLLLGVALHAADRLDAGQELTDLEQRLVDLLGAVVGEEEVRSYGREYRQQDAGARAELFPSAVGRLSAQDGYSSADLMADLPRLAEDIVVQPNVSVVDVTTVGNGEGFDTPEFLAALEEYGTGATVLTGPPLEEAARAGALDVEVRLKRFECWKSTGDTVFGPSDEIYWVAAAGSDVQSKTTYSSPEFGDIDAGSVRYFEQAVVFSGRMERTVFANIECWERDEGGIWAELKKTLGTVAEWCADKASEIMDNGDKEDASLTALVALVAGLLSALLGWLINDDDLVGERSLSFNRSALANLVSRPDGNYWDFRGNGHYRLFMQASTPGSIRVRHTTTTDLSTWTAGTALPTANSLAAPALAVYDNKLYCVLRGGHGQPNLFYSYYDGNNWSSDTALGAAFTSETAPALAAYKGKLYCAHRGPTTDKSFYYVTFDGRWSGITRIGRHVVHSQPALAVHNNLLYFVIRGADNHLYFNTFDGVSTWSDTVLLSNHQSADGPALAAFNNKLYCVYRGVNDEYLRWCTISGTTATTAAKLGTHQSAAAPALAVHNNQLYCIHRGAVANTNPKLYWSRFTGSVWSADTPFSPIATTAQAAAAASYKGTLHVVHPGGGTL